jgi:DNA-binding LacI/PurR family transcriptional regulator
MEDVAARVGVSRALVSLVMRGAPNVSDRSRRAVLAAADELGYRPNVLARNLASRRTSTIGLLLNDLHNPFFAEIADGVLEIAHEADHEVLIAAGERRASRELAAVESLLRFRPEGIIVVGPRLPASDLASTGRSVPVVAVGRAFRAHTIDTVVNDDAAGAAQAVRHLASLGHRAIVHVDGGPGAGARARRRGYERTMADLGLAAYTRTIHGDFTEESGVAAAESLLAGGDLPTAVFAANDLMAAGALDRLEDAGLDVPCDVSIVGYDNTFLAALSHMSLTTVDQPRAEMGRLAARALLARLDVANAPPVRHVVAPSLVVRGTTGPVRPSDRSFEPLPGVAHATRPARSPRR